MKLEMFMEVHLMIKFNLNNPMEHLTTSHCGFFSDPLLLFQIILHSIV